MAEGFFRSKKGFTVVQNEITKDASISLKAKGLYLVIQAYISMPDKIWTKDDFIRLTKEGKKAFESAWQELKDTGYLKVHCMANDGKWRTEYELLDAPQLGAHIYYHNKEGEITSDNLKRAAKKQVEEIKQVQQEENRYPLFGSNGSKEDRYPPFGSNGNGSNGNGYNGNGNNGCGYNGNGGNNNKDFKEKPLIKTNITNNIIPNPNLNPEPTKEEPNAAEKYPMNFILEYFHEDDLMVMGLPEQEVELVMDILYDTLNSTRKELWVGRQRRTIDIVRSRLMKLTVLDIEYAIGQYKKQTGEIHHQKAYMLTLLYDARGQGELDISNQVMHDMYGG